MTEGKDALRLFDESTIRKLEQLTLTAEQVRVGLMKGDRRSRKRGTSIEFADYRDYVRGDDLRKLDWNIFARLQQPFIKLLEEEEDLSVQLLIDGSLSMDWPVDNDLLNKFDYGRRLVAALAVIGLAAGDQVHITRLTGDQEISSGPFRGKGNTVRILQLLQVMQALGETDLNRVLQRYAHRARRPGLLILISDLLSPAGFKEGLGMLQARGNELALLHLLSPDEMQPISAGDVKLVDVETSGTVEVTLDEPTIERYRQRLQAWLEEIAGFCGRRGIHYIPVNTELAWQTLVMQTLRVQGLVR